MVIVELAGGLGNQMFQYAFGRSLSLTNNDDLFLDVNFLLDRSPRENFVYRNFDLDIFDNKYAFCNSNVSLNFGMLRSKFYKIKNKIIPYKQINLIQEKNDYNKNSVFEKNGNIYLNGYWQNYKYFDSISKIIQQDFSFKDYIFPKSTELLNEIRSTNSVCLNVRRSDFVGNSNHGELPLEYYFKAEEIIISKIEDPIVYVFSDDINWCRENLKLKSKTIFVDHQFADLKFKNYLNLMTNCKHFIIPNSSFAWWAAWLSEFIDKIVIAPEIWLHSNNVKTKTISPTSWIII